MNKNDSAKIKVVAILHLDLFQSFIVGKCKGNLCSMTAYNVGKCNGILCSLTAVNVGKCKGSLCSMTAVNVAYQRT